MNRYVFRILNIFQKPDFLPIGIRVWALRRMGVAVGKKSVIMAGCDFIQGNIKIGENVFINRRCLIDGSAAISIEDGVQIGHDTLMITSTHQIGISKRRAGPSIAEKIDIGEGSWLGARVTVLAGTSVGRGTVVAAGAVVTNVLSDDSLYGGVPASLRRRL